MKRVIGLAIISIVFSAHIIAGNSGSQPVKEITVETVTKDISRGKQPGMKIAIYQATKKDVVKDWSKLISKNTKSKVEERENEVFIIGASIAEISAAPLNIYAVINDYIDHIEVNAFFETPDGFITKENSETAFLSCRKFLRDFGVLAYKDAVSQEKKKEEKSLAALNSELKSIVQTNDKLHKNIAKEERDIIDARNDIKANDIEQERLRTEIHKGKTRLYDIRGEDARKEAEKEVKELEKTLSGLKKQNENLHKEIVNSEADIRSYERSINDNNLLVARKEMEIDSQLEVIYQVEQKLLAIR